MKNIYYILTSVKILFLSIPKTPIYSFKYNSSEHTVANKILALLNAILLYFNTKVYFLKVFLRQVVYFSRAIYTMLNI